MRSETFWYGLLLAALFVTVLAVADMNWPAHMGEQGALLKAIGVL